MDHRIALKPNTLLPFNNKNGGMVVYTVVREIGRGGSCIVYEASYDTNTGDKKLVRIKECYPYKLNITRNEEDSLLPEQSDEAAFSAYREKLCADFSVANKLFYAGDNYDTFVNALDIYAFNGTVYIVYAFSSEKTLASYKPVSVRECVTFTKQAAYILAGIHNQGYLYLDIKPNNLLIADGIQKRVLLFDFDSLLPISYVKSPPGRTDDNIRLSYSKGFAPIELQMSKLSRLGPHTDVYEVGALLFYLIFGRTPDAPDCENDADYDFTKLQYDCDGCGGGLFTALCAFFHKTLVNFYMDRWQNMKQVFERLCEIEKLADTTVPHIISSVISRPRCVFGRRQELEEMDRLLAEPGLDCLFVTGIGGIGKSTLVREYLFGHRYMFDNVLYMRFSDSVEKTVADDKNININTLKQAEETRAGIRYFDKKITKLRELLRNTASIIVIDDFTGEMDNELRDIIEMEWKVVVVTRQAPPCKNSYVLNVSSVCDRQALIEIFEANLGRPLESYERYDFLNIVQKVDGHTLILELIAKQIAGSHMTVSRAAEFLNENGFSALAPEKIAYQKDNLTGRNTIGGIVDTLFETGSLSANKKTLLKTISLLGSGGMDIGQYCHFLGLESMDDINELAADGWLAIDADILTMHPVIKEAVCRWEWNTPYTAAAEMLLTSLYTEIYAEATKNNFVYLMPRKAF